MKGWQIFDLTGKTALVTGGTGVLGGEIAKGLACAGAKIAILGRRKKMADTFVEVIAESGGHAIAIEADVLDPHSLNEARSRVEESWGRLDILFNCAGGNIPEATVTAERPFFSLQREAVQQVLDLNLQGTILPCQIFGQLMAEQKQGCIVNISSMAAQRPLTRVVGYSAAKAAIENFTKWLAVELALKFGPGLRVNAIAPGFFLGEQNRSLLIGEDGSPTARGKSILAHTPMARFGDANDLVGAAVWLASDMARFVTGIVVPIDGGFSAYAGI